MKEFFSSFNLVFKKSGGRLPVVMFLLVAAIAFAAINNRNAQSAFTESVSENKTLSYQDLNRLAQAGVPNIFSSATLAEAETICGSGNVITQAVDLRDYVVGPPGHEHSLTTGERITYEGRIPGEIKMYKNANYEQFIINGSDVLRREDTSWAPLQGFKEAHCTNGHEAAYTLDRGCNAYGNGQSVNNSGSVWIPGANSKSVGDTWTTETHQIVTIDEEVLKNGGGLTYCELDGREGLNNVYNNQHACNQSGSAVLLAVCKPNTINLCSGANNAAELAIIKGLSGPGTGDTFYYMKGYGLVGFEAPGFKASLTDGGNGTCGDVTGPTLSCNTVQDSFIQNSNNEYCQDNLIDGSFENGGNYSQQEGSILVPEKTHAWYQHSLNSDSKCGDYVQQPIDGDPDTACGAPEIIPRSPLSAAQCSEAWTTHGNIALKVFSSFSSMNGGLCFDLPAEVTANGGKAGFDVRVKENSRGGPFGGVSLFLGTSPLNYEQINGNNWANLNWATRVNVEQTIFDSAGESFVSRSLNIDINSGAKSLCLRVNNEKPGIGVDSFWDGGYVTANGLAVDSQCKTALQSADDDGISRQGGGNCQNTCDPLAKKNPYDKEVLKIPDHWYANSCYLEDRGNNSATHESGVGGLVTMIKLNSCEQGSNMNPNFTCDPVNYTAGYVHTATPRNVKLLNYLSAFEKKANTQNNFSTWCNTVNTVFNFTPNELGKFQIDWGKQFPGLARVVSSAGPEGNLRIPGLGSASSCGIINPNNVLTSESEPTVIHPYAELTQFEQVEKAIGSFLGSIVDFLKNLFEEKSILNNEDTTGTVNRGNECVVSKVATISEEDEGQVECGIGVSTLCPSLAGGQITHLNFSDKKKISTDHENGANEERVLIEENLVFTKNDVCDRQFRDTPAEGYVGGATCTLDNVTKGNFEWNGSLFNIQGGISSSKSAGARRLINVRLIPVFGPGGVIIDYREECDVCGQSVSCHPSQSEVYGICRGAGGNVTAITGDPYFNIKKPGYDVLEMIGLNKFLYNVWTQERLSGVKPVIHNDNVGINGKIGYGVYDLQKPIPDLPHGTSLNYRPSDYVPEDSEHYLKKFMAYEEQPYLAPYEGGYFPSFIEDTGTSYPPYISRAQIAYYFPWLGQIPRMMERISFFTTNPYRDKVRNALDNCNFAALDEDPDFDQNLKDIYKNVFIPCCGDQNYNDNNSDCYQKDEGNVLETDPLAKFLFTAKSRGGAGFDPAENAITKKFAKDEPDQCIPVPGPINPTPPAGNCEYDNVLEKISAPTTTLNISNNSSDHVGTDFGAGMNSPVFAVGAGEVVYVTNTTIRDSRYFNQDSTQAECYGLGQCDWLRLPIHVDTYNIWAGAYGNVIGIKHADGVTVYAHLNNGTVRVNPGECVSRGQQIAASGNTGNSTGPHLHFEVRKLGCTSYSQSCVVNNNTSSNIDSSLGTGDTGGTPIPPGTETTTYCEDPENPGDPGNPGIPNEGGLNCLIKRAAASLNSGTSRIAPEIIYAIMRQETSFVCPATWDTWRSGDRTPCTGDPNQTAFASRNRVAWEGRIERGLCPVDVRGLTQFAAGPPGSGSCANTFNGVTSSQKASMEACIRALGVDNSINSSLWSDPLSSDPNFSRHRVGDAICAAAIKLSEDAKFKFGRYITEAEWRNLNGIGGEALTYVSSRYHGNCSLGYCDNTRRFASEVLGSGLFNNLSCSTTGTGPNQTTVPVGTDLTSRIQAIINSPTINGRQNFMKEYLTNYNNGVNPDQIRGVIWSEVYCESNINSPVISCPAGVTDTTLFHELMHKAKKDNILRGERFNGTHPSSELQASILEGLYYPNTIHSYRFVDKSGNPQTATQLVQKLLNAGTSPRELWDFAAGVSNTLLSKISAVVQNGKATEDIYCRGYRGVYDNILRNSGVACTN